MKITFRRFRRHKCGYTEEGNSNFWTTFRSLCPQCGEFMEYGSVESFNGYYKYTGKWYNPLTWFNFTIIKK